MRLSARPRRRQFQEIVSEACGLMHRDGQVRSIHIVGGDRPTYEQLRRYRKSATNDHVKLSVDRDGVITIVPDAS
jgi:hypothetical protein